MTEAGIQTPGEHDPGNSRAVPAQPLTSIFRPVAPVGSWEEIGEIPNFADRDPADSIITQLESYVEKSKQELTEPLPLLKERQQTLGIINFLHTDMAALNDSRPTTQAHNLLPLGLLKSTLARHYDEVAVGGDHKRDENLKFGLHFIKKKSQDLYPEIKAAIALYNLLKERDHPLRRNASNALAIYGRTIYILIRAYAEQASARAPEKSEE